MNKALSALTLVAFAAASFGAHAASHAGAAPMKSASAAAPAKSASAPMKATSAPAAKKKEKKGGC